MTGGGPAAAEAATVSGPLQAVDLLREGFALFDGELRVTVSNARFAELMGYPPQLCRPRTSFLEMARFTARRSDPHGSRVDNIVRDWLTRLASPEPLSFGELRPDGTLLSFRVTPVPGGGTLLGCLEISKPNLVERALADEHALLAVFADEAPVMLILTDADNELVYLNQRNLTFSGRRLEECLGDGWQADIHPDDLPDMLTFLSEAARSREAYEYEYRLRRADGVYCSMREIGAPRWSPDGSFAGFVCIVEDITDAKAQREELARQREALLQSEKLSALGSLLAGVAHELNNPLSVVAGQAQLLQETAPDAKTAARADKIRAAAERCSKIVKTFLAMARRRPPERGSVELNRLVESALEVLGYGLRTAGVKVELDVAPDLPTTHADGDQLQQVLTNLVVNAQQAMMEIEGPRRLRIVTRFDAAANMLHLEVADSGPGVPPAIRSRIFEPFFTTKPAGVGTGVGLSLCHGIVESHGGSIAVEEAPGGGARFVVRLPHVEAATRALEPDSADSGTAGTASRSILVVDDEADIAEILAEILTEAGHRVDIASSGRAALDCIARQDYELVLSDLRMPELDGPGLYRALQARRPDWPERMVFVTGDTLSQAAAAFLERTRRPCIEKPFNAEEVRRVVAAALQSPALQPPTPQSATP